MSAIYGKTLMKSFVSPEELYLPVCVRLSDDVLIGHLRGNGITVCEIFGATCSFLFPVVEEMLFDVKLMTTPRYLHGWNDNHQVLRTL